jgi:UDP-glucuronate 4-epimerase
MKVLVTGAAGFIGMHVCQRLLARGDEVIGIDNLNDYYDVSLKEARLAQLRQHTNFRFARIDIADRVELAKLFEQEKLQSVVHLAAQAGVRYSLTNPHAYADSNLIGFVNVLEGCRHTHVQHLVYASSSSVYNGNTKTPFSETDSVDQPVSLYAATKKANELMAHAHSHLYGIPATGLRFFTVYGPWGRPDMAYFSFTQAILEGRPIDVFNHGQLQRDFTYIDDITECVVRVLDKPATLDVGVPHRVFNIGNHEPIALLVFIETLEKALGREAIKNFQELSSHAAG